MVSAVHPLADSTLSRTMAVASKGLHMVSAVHQRSPTATVPP